MSNPVTALALAGVLAAVYFGLTGTIWAVALTERTLGNGPLLPDEIAVFRGQSIACHARGRMLCARCARP